MNISRKHKKAIMLREAWELYSGHYTGIISYHYEDAINYVRDNFQRYGRKYKK